MSQSNFMKKYCSFEVFQTHNVSITFHKKTKMIALKLSNKNMR